MGPVPDKANDPRRRVAVTHPRWGSRWQRRISRGSANPPEPYYPPPLSPEENAKKLSDEKAKDWQDTLYYLMSKGIKPSSGIPPYRPGGREDDF